MSYHNGSIWPHDNAIIAAGFARYGLRSAATAVFDSLYETSRYMELQRMPELFCGFHRRPDGSGPTLYPVACAPQAWAAGAVFLMLRSSLGLDIVPAEPAILLPHPWLPAALSELRIDNLQVGQASVDLVFRRRGEQIDVEVAGRRGAIEVRELI
jgi:glycogen debranching enzyme